MRNYSLVYPAPAQTGSRDDDLSADITSRAHDAYTIHRDRTKNTLATIKKNIPTRTFFSSLSFFFFYPVRYVVVCTRFLTGPPVVFARRVFFLFGGRIFSHRFPTVLVRNKDDRGAYTSRTDNNITLFMPVV